MKFSKPFRFAVLITFLSYIILNAIVVYNGVRYENELSKFDLNQDGFFTNEEVSAEQNKALLKVSNDTARTLAPVTLIPLSIIPGFFAFLITKRLTVKRWFLNN
jgi:hypothetical protein